MNKSKKNQFGERIGTLREGGLHRDLKLRYATPHGRIEQRVGRYVVDVMQDDHIVEIQTSNFGVLPAKVQELQQRYSVTVVHPIAARKTIVKERNGQEDWRRSPKRGTLLDFYRELVHAPKLLTLPNVSLELVFVHMKETRIFDAQRAWRRKNWVIKSRELISVCSTMRFENMPSLYHATLNDSKNPYTVREIAEKLEISVVLARKIAYCFREAGVLRVKERRGNAIVYEPTMK